MAETLEPETASVAKASAEPITVETPIVPTGDEDIVFRHKPEHAAAIDEPIVPTGDEDIAFPTEPETEVEAAPAPEVIPEPDYTEADREVPGLPLLFLDARTPIGWTDRPVEDSTLRRLYDLAKLGPTSANSSPARFLFLRSREAKEKLRQTLSPGNVEGVMAAPVTVIVAYDPVFYDNLFRLYPQADARSWFAWNDEFSQETAFRNGTLQGGYLIAAARLLGLDCWPMSGVDTNRVDQLFLDPRGWRSNFLVSLGYGVPPEGPRNPRLTFDEACELL
jgi:3-hydroxypropanoate dehydrogenase